MVDISFITVNFNTAALVEQMMTFFRAVDLPFSFRLVIVDNGSADGSQNLLELAKDDFLVYLQTNRNLGYGRGMNLGLAAVPSRYACIMNTDVVLNREVLVGLWEFFEANSEVGVASPVILGSDQRIQGFLTLPGILSLYLESVAKVRSKIWKLRLKNAEKPLKVPGVMGAFFMIRRDSFSDKLFDEDFFFYYEDTELAHRYWKQGVPCYVLPQISIVHLGGRSTSAAGAILFQKSRRLFIEKTYGYPHSYWLAKLDHLRLSFKYFKYRLLSALLKAPGIASKYAYYAKLRESYEK